MYNEKICQRLRANSVVSAWENQRLLRCEKWPRKEKNLQADKMLEQSNKRFKSAEEGENVNVPIPEVDRGRLDPPNFTDVIQEHDFWDRTLHFGDKSWNSEHTVLKKPINLMNQKFLTTADIPEDVTLSVREAARLHSNAGGQGFFKCLCQTACLTKKCKCIRDSVKCSSRCKNRSCHNPLFLLKFWN